MLITEEIRAEILQRIDIVDLVGESIDLRKKGRNFIGLCPFHDDKKPSLNVSTNLGIYKCFACGAGGDAIAFMINYHHLTYPEAMKELARRTGVVIPEKQTKREVQQLSKRELALKALEAATEFYAKKLISENGKIAQTFFRKRGFKPELISQFRLGYSPDSWDGLITELKNLNFSDDVLNDAGLVVQNEQKGFYDRFRNRAMFPIQDFLGKIIGFGARQLDENDKMGKYVNSPQSIVYDKSQTLYGLFQAKNEIRSKKYAILVEGYADVLSLHQEGFTNTIASSGTALTKEQLNLLSRYCKKIMISYDGDSAGLNAADRAMVLCIENGFEVNIIHLPEGEDPDSLVQTHGSQLYNKYIDEALSFVEFRIMLLKRTGSISSPPGRATAAREIVQLISKIPDRLQHDDYIRQLSSAIQINESQLLQIYKEKSRNEKNIKEKITVQPKQSNSESHEFQKISTTSKNGEKSDESFKNLFSEETLLITLSLTEPGALDLMVDKYEISSDTFFTDEAKRYFEIILHHSSDNNLVANILGSNLISETDKHFFTYIVFNKEELSEHWQKFSDRETEKDIERIIRDCVYRLEFKFLEAKKDELLKRAKNITDSAKESDILIECKKIDEQIKLLDEKYIDSNKN